jgi:microcystin-dependent protein
MNNGKGSQGVFHQKRQPYKLIAIILGVFFVGLLAINAVHASFDPPSAPPIGGVPTGIISVGRGGTGLSSPGANNNVLTSNGTSWVSSAPAGGSQWTTIAGGIYYNSGKVGIGTATPNNTFQVGNYINFTDPAALDYGTYIGYQAGNVADGARNTLIGYWAGLSNAAGVDNTAVGMSALLYNTASNNTALGQNALRSVSGLGSGGSNTAIGNSALSGNTSGSSNTATGRQSLYSNTTGVNNTANGYYSLLNNSTGSGNIAVGNYAGAYETGSNAFYINNQDRTDTAGDKAKSLMYGTFAVDPLNQKLTINANVGVGTVTPGARLEVAGSSNATQFIVRANAVQSNTNPLIKLLKSDGTVLASLHSDNLNNTFLGLDAGRVNNVSGIASEGLYNTFMGSSAGYSNTTGYYNTAVGTGSLNTNSTGYSNTALGGTTLLFNTIGYRNTAVGMNALRANNTGYYNSATGMNALRSNTTGYYNTAVGGDALYTNVDGYLNTAVGGGSLFSNSNGYYNTAVGMNSLNRNMSGPYNTAVGGDALYFNTSGGSNTALGVNALNANNTGSWNTGLGRSALNSNTTGTYNSAAGLEALYTNNTGYNNAAAGTYALRANSTGYQNSAMGMGAGRSITIGNSNTFLGYNAGYNVSQKVNVINSMALGNATYTTLDNQVVIGNTSVTQTLLNGNVGIGIGMASPTAKLQIGGTAGVDGIKFPDGTLQTTAASGGGTPSGSVISYAGSTAPSGWLMADGSAVSRVTYSVLFAVIGTTYGSGDGATTFNLPNLKGKTPVGFNAAETEFNALGKTGGEKTHLLSVAEMPSHTHTVRYAISGGTYTSPTVGNNGSEQGDINTGSAGSNAAHNNLQPYIALNFIIKI